MEKAPHFTLIDQSGAEFDLYEALKESNVLLVFYPLAFSGVCSNELSAIQERLADFAAEGVRPVAVSVDSMHAQRAFAEAKGYEFTLLADFWPHGAVAQKFAAFNEEAGIAERKTFFIGQDGTILSQHASPISQPRSVEEYLEAAKSCAIR